MNVLSLFDGMSCGMIALQRANIKIDKYYASEIDKYAETVSKANYPEIIRLGDVVKINIQILPKIDLLIGGSPCQTLSVAGNGSGFSGKSGLFFEYVRILNELKIINPNIKFLLENVKMKKEWADIISFELGVEPIEINSRLVSAQNRKRLYWTNILDIPTLEDKNILLQHVIERNVDSKYFYSEKAISYLDRTKMNKRFAMYSDNDKSVCLTANFHKSLPYNVYVDRDKSHCITQNYGNMACVNYNKGQGQIVFDNNSIRRLTPLECERLQTVPEGYTNYVSDTQRYRMLGNGWTVDVIAHIFKNLK